MAIEGDLRSLNITSVLQLISREQLTGVLKIKKYPEVADVGFIDGDVAGAFFEVGERAERLETYLVKSGMIGKNLFEMIEDIHRETKRPVINIIIEDKYLTIEEIERTIKFKIQEVMDELFTWNEGEFKFEEGVLIYPKSVIKIRMHTEGLILESARRLDEWPRISKAVPSGDIVFKRVDRPELKLQLKEDEARVLSLIDERRSVDDLLEISGLGKFHTYACLYHLQSTGQIEVAYAKPSVKKKEPKIKISIKSLAAPIAVAVAAGILIVEIVAGGVMAHTRVFSFNWCCKDEHADAHDDYRKIFFYKHQRLPSAQEVDDLF
ncbi:MAG: DUF4388 domain-containing protein [candidate division WOR-3 bacterium]|nr:MAG: DUF4388 domain-containing protein [candidate division WOR-3 bacterium]